MSMLMFLPWCQINNATELGEMTILPFHPQGRPNDVDHAEWDAICKILSCYKDINGQAVPRAALVQVNRSGVTSDLTPEDIAVARDLMALTCFSALANRDFAFDSNYCNSDCFSFVIQKFNADSTFTTLVPRRRHQRSLSVWEISEVAISVPIHCHTVRNVSIDVKLLEALLTQRQSASADWGRWQNAVTCFNQANTDSDNISDQVEWVLLCSAFEHLLKAKSRAKDVARLFGETVVPDQSLNASQAARTAVTSPANRQSVRCKWMYEFYRVRGDFAHGQLNTQQPMVWRPHEHLFLATIAFPLLVKALLAQDGAYELTDNDSAQIACFEELANTDDFIAAPPNRTGSDDSHWRRLLSTHFRKKQLDEFKNEALKALADGKEAGEEASQE